MLQEDSFLKYVTETIAMKPIAYIRFDFVTVCLKTLDNSVKFLTFLLLMLNAFIKRKKLNILILFVNSKKFILLFSSL